MKYEDYRQWVDIYSPRDGVWARWDEKKTVPQHGVDVFVTQDEQLEYHYQNWLDGKHEMALTISAYFESLYYDLIVEVLGPGYLE